MSNASNATLLLPPASPPSNATLLLIPPPSSPPVVPCCSMKDALLIAIICVSSINVFLFCYWLSSRCRPRRFEDRPAPQRNPVRQEAALAAAEMISASMPAPPPASMPFEGRLNGRTVSLRVVQRGPGARFQTEPTIGGSHPASASSDVLFFNEHERVSPTGELEPSSPPWRAVERPIDMPIDEDVDQFNPRRKR